MKLKLNKVEKRYFTMLCEKWSVSPAKIMKSLEDTETYRLFGHEAPLYYGDEIGGKLEEMIASWAMD